jgi:hypothetical protein
MQIEKSIVRNVVSLLRLQNSKHIVGNIWRDDLRLETSYTTMILSIRSVNVLRGDTLLWDSETVASMS